MPCEGTTASSGGIDYGCDVPAYALGDNIYNGSGCSIFDPDRISEEADSDIQGLHQSQNRLYRSDLLLAVSLALGHSLH